MPFKVKPSHCSSDSGPIGIPFCVGFAYYTKLGSELSVVGEVDVLLSSRCLCSEKCRFWGKCQNATGLLSFQCPIPPVKVSFSTSSLIKRRSILHTSCRCRKLGRCLSYALQFFERFPCPKVLAPCRPRPSDCSPEVKKEIQPNMYISRMQRKPLLKPSSKPQTAVPSSQVGARSVTLYLVRFFEYLFPISLQDSRPCNIFVSCILLHLVPTLLSTNTTGLLSCQKAGQPPSIQQNKTSTE
jgi:hypothetical protein